MTDPPSLECDHFLATTATRLNAGLRLQNDSDTSAYMDPTIDPKLLNDPVFKRVLEDALSIQDRFSAEPVYARTGKGFLKSEGVEKLQQIKAGKRRQKE